MKAKGWVMRLQRRREGQDGQDLGVGFSLPCGDTLREGPSMRMASSGRLTALAEAKR